MSKGRREEITPVPGRARIGVRDQIACEELHPRYFDCASHIERLVHVVLWGVIDVREPFRTLLTSLDLRIDSLEPPTDPHRRNALAYVRSLATVPS